MDIHGFGENLTEHDGSVNIFMLVNIPKNWQEPKTSPNIPEPSPEDSSSYVRIWREGVGFLNFMVLVLVSFD